MTSFVKTSALCKNFDTPAGTLHAVDHISFTLERGKTLGVVGESGCGKSTLGRMLVGLLDVTAGTILFDDRDVTRLGRHERRELRREMQMIFQDPLSSLDPRLCTLELIAEPLQIFKLCSTKEELEERVFALMDMVGLSRQTCYAYPHELDGGRRQRVGIARALALEPSFIVCDEPVSALDVSIQAQVLNLLRDLQQERGLTYLFITHDLSVVRHVSDDILVMYMGQMVEKASARVLFEHPAHPYTQGLLSAIPVPNIHHKQERIIMQGEISSAINMKPGCRFAPRCAHAQACCHTESPVLREVSSGHTVTCHLCSSADESRV